MKVRTRKAKHRLVQNWCNQHGGTTCKISEWAVGKLKNSYAKFSARYGRRGAVAIMAAMAVTMPLPGNILAVIGVAEGVRAVASRFAGTRNASIEDILEDVRELAEQLDLPFDEARFVEVYEQQMTTNESRSAMPQIRKEHFEEFLDYVKEHTSLTYEAAVDPHDLNAIQSEYDQERVDAIPDEKLKWPILTSKDGYVLDGNHRWIRAGQEGVTIPVLRIGLDRDDALELVRLFPKAEYVENELTDNWCNQYGGDTCKGGSASKLTKGKPLAPKKHASVDEATAYARASIKSRPPTEAEAEALDFYSSDNYAAINSPLRSGKEPRGKTRSAIENLDSLIASSTTRRDMVLSRGLTLRGKSLAMLKGMKPGGMFRDNGYTSTTAHEPVVEDFLTSKGVSVLVRIAVPKGSNAYQVPSHAEFSGGGGEAEILLPRGSSFRIRSVRQENGNTVVDAEYVQPQAASGRSRRVTRNEETALSNRFIWGIDDIELEHPVSNRLSARAKRKLANNARKTMPGPNKIDPTRTTNIRASFLKKLRAKFALLRGKVRNLVVTEDAFGLQAGNDLKMATNRYQFKTSPQKIEEFQKWLRQQFRSTLTGKTDEQLWKEFARQGYLKGAGRAFDDVNDAIDDTGKSNKPRRLRRFLPGEGDFYEGSRAEFLRSSFARPETVEKIQLLAGRSFDDLENVTEDMATRMSRTLTDGLSQGMNPREVARLLDDDLDLGARRAEVIARTEIIRAHAEGQLDSMKAMGVQTVGAEVEWSTAGDGRVCPECSEMEGKIYSIDDARGLIPMHPNCVLPGNFVQGRITAALKAWYAGEVVELRTAKGARVSLTVNHPVLTEHGFVLAGQLHEGDYLACHLGKPQTSVYPRVEQAPALVEDVFDSFSTPFRQEPVSGFDFNGDEECMVGKVEVVLPDLPLNELVPGESESKLQVSLVPPDPGVMGGGYLIDSLGLGHSAPFEGLGLALASRGQPVIQETAVNRSSTYVESKGDSVSRLTRLEQSTNLCDVQDAAVSCPYLGSASRLDAGLDEPVREGRTLDTDLFAQLVGRFPGEVALDEVVEIRRFHYSGSVYDVETTPGYFTANQGGQESIIIKNCRCAWLPAGFDKLMEEPTDNAFCPTGPGGGQVNTCPPANAGTAVHKGSGLPIGHTYLKTYKGTTYQVVVNPNGFDVVGPNGTQSYPSLTAAAKGLRGNNTAINGWAFFGIDKPAGSAPSSTATQPTPTPASAAPKDTIPYKPEHDFTTGKAEPGVLNGIPFSSAPPKFWEKTPDKDVGEHAPVHKIERSSVLIQEPDGRVWIVQPTNQFGDRKYTIPGGTNEPHLTNQQNALKEIWEETGLQVEITGHLGDFQDSNNGRYGRLYVGKRIGGAPWEAKIENSIRDKNGNPAAESERVTLVTPEIAAQRLHRTDDLAQIATIQPIKVNTLSHGNMMKKLVEGMQPAAKSWERRQTSAGRSPSSGDSTLHAAQQLRGFNAQPTVVDRSRMDALITQGTHIEMLRGVKGAGSATARQLADEFKTGDHFPGHGCFGSGTYADSTRGRGNVASQYGAGGDIIRMAIPRSAKIIKQSELENLVGSPPSTYHNPSHHSSSDSWLGVQATLAGYDAIHVDGNGHRHGSYGRGFYVILNRGIVTVQKESAKGHRIS